MSSYSKAEKTINNILTELHRVISHLSEQLQITQATFGPYQIINNSIIIHEDYNRHTVLFRSFELNTIKVFTSLYEGLLASFNDVENVYQEFSFRTLHEISHIKIPILFGNQVSQKDKDRYKILSLTDDFVFVYNTNPEWMLEHKKLIAEKRALLSESEKRKIAEIQEALKNSNILHAHKLSSGLLKEIEGELKQKNTLPAGFNKDSANMLYAGFSKLLHGDIPLMIDLFSPNRTNRVQYRKTYVLLSSGINSLIHLSTKFPQLQIDTEKFRKQYSSIVNEITSPSKII